MPQQLASAHNRTSINGRKPNWRPFKFAWRIEIGERDRRGYRVGGRGGDLYDASDTHGGQVDRYIRITNITPSPTRHAHTRVFLSHRISMRSAVRERTCMRACLLAAQVHARTIFSRSHTHMHTRGRARRSRSCPDTHMRNRVFYLFYLSVDTPLLPPAPATHPTLTPQQPRTSTTTRGQ